MVGSSRAKNAVGSMLWVALTASAYLGLPLGAIATSCANTVTAPPKLVNLVFKFQVLGQLSKDERVRYLFFVDVLGEPGDGPMPYGPWLRDKPTNGWDLPFFIANYIQGTEEFLKIAIESNVWTHAFVFSYVAGRPEIKLWQQELDGTKRRIRIDPRPPLTDQDFRLTVGGAAGIPGAPPPPNADTVELTLSLDRFISVNKLEQTKQIEANLVVQVVPPIEAISQDTAGWKIDQWFPADNLYFPVSVESNRPAEQKTALDAVPQFQQNVPPGIPPGDVALKSYSSEIKKQGGL